MTDTLTTPRADERGFTLIELIVAMLIIVVGVLGLAGVMVNVSARQTLATSRMELVALAEGKLEELRADAMIMSADTAQLTVGGSTTLSVANHADTVAGPSGRIYITRWQVAAAPAGCRHVTLRVVPLVDDARSVARLEFSTILMVVR